MPSKPTSTWYCSLESVEMVTSSRGVMLRVVDQVTSAGGAAVWSALIQ
jgi:hypothetical protein